MYTHTLTHTHTLAPLSHLPTLSPLPISACRIFRSLRQPPTDLAARNCLVDAELVVKVADFGRSRNINYSQYYKQDDKGVMPIRWMSPEALMDGRFSHKSDVWSFGVVFWEIVTFGQLPYPGMSNQEVFERVCNSHRMEQPVECADVLYGQMLRCWAFKPQLRPTFAEMRDKLQDIFQAFIMGR